MQQFQRFQFFLSAIKKKNKIKNRNSFSSAQLKNPPKNLLKLNSVQTEKTLLDVTCCVHLHTLLHVVERSWELLRKVETGQTLGNNVGSCWVCLHVA